MPPQDPHVVSAGPRKRNGKIAQRVEVNKVLCKQRYAWDTAINSFVCQCSRQMCTTVFLKNFSRPRVVLGEGVTPNDGGLFFWCLRCLSKGCPTLSPRIVTFPWFLGICCQIRDLHIISFYLVNKEPTLDHACNSGRPCSTHPMESASICLPFLFQGNPFTRSK